MIVNWYYRWTIPMSRRFLVEFDWDNRNFG